MKSTGKLIVFICTFLALATSAYAQSPREQLNQMVQQLQQTPRDSTLREKIIKLATSIKPAPAIPEEALRREGRAKFAFKNAKSNDDYLGAAREYEEAVQAAPWVSGYYLDLCTIYEKAEKYAEAKRNCQFSLSGLSEPSQINEVKQRIAGLEFGIEKANSPEARAGKQKTKEEELLKSLDGAVFSYSDTDMEVRYQISNGRAVRSDRRLGPGGALCGSGGHMSGPIGEQMRCPDPENTVPLVGRRGEISTYWGPTKITIAEDGQTLHREWYGGDRRAYNKLFKRQ